MCGNFRALHNRQQMFQDLRLEHDQLPFRFGAITHIGIPQQRVFCFAGFEPLGINLETSRFLDAFLLFCALDASAETNQVEGAENLNNFALTVKRGREPGLKLHTEGQEILLKEWGEKILEKIRPAAQLLDLQSGAHAHADSIRVQWEKLQSPDSTPSARVLAAIRLENGSFNRFAIKQSQYFADQFVATPPDAESMAYFDQLAANSLAEQVKMEAEQSGSFDEFIEDYRSRTSSEICCDG